VLRRSLREWSSNHYFLSTTLGVVKSHTRTVVSTFSLVPSSAFYWVLQWRSCHIFGEEKGKGPKPPASSPFQLTLGSLPLFINNKQCFLESVRLLVLTCQPVMGDQPFITLAAGGMRPESSPLPLSSESSSDSGVGLH